MWVGRVGLSLNPNNTLPASQSVPLRIELATQFKQMRSDWIPADRISVDDDSQTSMMDIFITTELRGWGNGLIKARLSPQHTVSSNTVSSTHRGHHPATTFIACIPNTTQCRRLSHSVIFAYLHFGSYFVRLSHSLSHSLSPSRKLLCSPLISSAERASPQLARPIGEATHTELEKHFLDKVIANLGLCEEHHRPPPTAPCSNTGCFQWFRCANLKSHTMRKKLDTCFPACHLVPRQFGVLYRSCLRFCNCQSFSFIRWFMAIPAASAKAGCCCLGLLARVTVAGFP
ncbi:hypothetical protein PIB30_049223 [Stylosanthes scabra]|uniref:Uncharacterized protein n=1 Tax=Stylosanthes scabra TaxID=79078 RepID=A0ABU6ZG20_9FABA|nr:hypothetical protein [Stylosanthes scabra]